MLLLLELLLLHINLFLLSLDLLLHFFLVHGPAFRVVSFVVLLVLYAALAFPVSAWKKLEILKTLQ